MKTVRLKEKTPDKTALKESSSGKRISEPVGWLFNDRNKTLKVAIFIVILFFALLIFYKSYRLNKSLEIKNAEMKLYAKQMEKIIAGSANLVFVTWKDQKEGILFTENPAYKSKSTSDLSKAQQIQYEINQYQEDINSKQKDIKKLQEKERVYNEEIEKLRIEVEKHKSDAFGFVQAFGNRENIVREFK